MNSAHRAVVQASIFLMAATVAVLLFGCAAQGGAPQAPQPYTIPVVKSDGTVQRFTVEPDEADARTGERMLFCIETPVQVMCIAESDGRALVYRMPILPQAQRPEYGAQP